MSAPITVVLVNYNAGEHLLACLDALKAQTVPHTVVLVDNASVDDSARRAHERFPDVHLLPLRHNVGFARAVNLAATRLNDDDGLLATLNPDTVPQPGFLEQLCRPFENAPQLGAASGTLTFASDTSIIASAGIDMHRNGVALDARLGQHWSDGDTTPIFGASGGAATYRLTAFRDAGGFPDAFFLYLEDVDLAWRLRLRGWQAVSVPGALATHVYSASAVEGSAFKRRLLARNRLWLLARCLPATIWERDRMSIVGFDSMVTGYAALRGDSATLAGRVQGLAGLPLRLHERRAIQSRARVSPAAIGAWLLPPVSPVKLQRLRALTARLAGSSPD